MVLHNVVLCSVVLDNLVLGSVEVPESCQFTVSITLGIVESD